MAEMFSADLTPVLSQNYDPVLRYQWNRTTVALNRTEIVSGGDQGDGQNVAWGAELPVAGAGASAFSAGSAIHSSEYAFDPNLPAKLDWASYRSVTNISGLAVDQARASRGSPTALFQLLDGKVKGGITRVTSLLNSEFINGTGSQTDPFGNPCQGIVGLLSALQTGGSYAGIDRAAYPAWAGNYFANGGVLRPLSVKLIQQMWTQIQIRSGRSPNRILVSFDVFNAYQALFTPMLRVQTQGPLPSQLALGTQTLVWNNIVIEPDKDMPPGTMIMLSDGVSLHALPRAVPTVEDIAMFEQLGIEVPAMSGNGFNPKDSVESLGLSLHVEILPKTGDSYPLHVYVRVQAKVPNPNACGAIVDIQA